MTGEGRFRSPAALATTALAARRTRGRGPSRRHAGGHGAPWTTRFRRRVAAETYAGIAARADLALAEPLVGVGNLDEAWACASCHGESGEGNGDIPRLRGCRPATS